MLFAFILIGWFNEFLIKWLDLNYSFVVGKLSATYLFYVQNLQFTAISDWFKVLLFI